MDRFRPPDASETLFEITAVLERVDGVLDESTPEPVGPFEAFVPGSLDLLIAALYQAENR